MAQMVPLELRIAQKKKDMEEHQPNANTTTTTSFLDLPLELRNEVYAHLFVQDKPINCYKVWFTTAERHLRRLGREKNEDGSAAHDENCCGVKRVSNQPTNQPTPSPTRALFISIYLSIPKILLTN